MQRTYCYVCNTHISATWCCTIERAKHICEVFGVDGLPVDIPATSGWALGSFGLRKREAAKAAIEIEGAGWLVSSNHSRAVENKADADNQREREVEGEGEARTSRQDARPRGCKREHPCYSHAVHNSRSQHSSVLSLVQSLQHFADSVLTSSSQLSTCSNLLVA